MPLIQPGDSPFELREFIIRDGRPRDLVNQLINLDDTVRIYTENTGWSSTRNYFVKHILPVWAPFGGFTMHYYLLAPAVSSEEELDPQVIKNTEENYVALYADTVIQFSREGPIRFSENRASDRIRTKIKDFMMVRIDRREKGIIFNEDVGA